MSTSTKSNDCPECIVECDGSASIKMNITKVFRSVDKTPSPPTYQWTADFNFDNFDMGELECDKGYTQGGGDSAKTEIENTLRQALIDHLDGLLGGTTTDPNFKPDVNTGDTFNGDMDFYVMITVRPEEEGCDPTDANVIPNGSPNIS